MPFLVTAAAIAMLCAQPAQAQGLTPCRSDIPLVLQPSTCLPNRRAGSAEIASAATPSAAPKPARKTLAELLRERDGADPRQQLVSERRPDGANVLKARMGAY